jgi:hypothetical protein
VRLTASSDATDLTGDIMSKRALNRMKNAAEGTTIFLNHDSTVPESVFGSVEKAELVTRSFAVNEGGKSQPVNLICLDYDVIVEETSERAVNVWRMIDAGTTKLGASVTIGIIDKTTLADGRRSIDDVVYLETSIVGIPCNQTAWVQYVKSKSWIQQAKRVVREWERLEAAEQKPVLELTNRRVDVDELLLTEPQEAAEFATESSVKTVIGSTGLPIADRNRAWSSTEAVKRIKEWANASDKPNSKYGRAFFYKTDGGGDKFGDFKLPFADIIDGTLTAVPKAVFAVAGVLQGARGGTKIPESDQTEIKKRVEGYYARFRSKFKDPSIVVPWKKEKKNMPTLVSAKDISEFILAFKDFFTDNVEDHLGNPWLYTALLENSLVELVYFNSSMPPDEKIAAASEMFDAFKTKMLEVLSDYFTEDEEGETKMNFVAAFNEAAAKFIAAKAGSRNNKGDQQTIQQVHDMMIDLGAACNSDTDEEKSVEASEDLTKKALEVEAPAPQEEVNTADADSGLTALTAAVDALNESLAAKAALSQQVYDLRKERDKLRLCMSEWKAVAETATAMLESHLDQPAPRPGFSTN